MVNWGKSDRVRVICFSSSSLIKITPQALWPASLSSCPCHEKARGNQRVTPELSTRIICVGGGRGGSRERGGEGGGADRETGTDRGTEKQTQGEKRDGKREREGEMDRGRTNERKIDFILFTRVTE